MIQSQSFRDSEINLKLEEHIETEDANFPLNDTNQMLEKEAKK